MFGIISVKLQKILIITPTLLIFKSKSNKKSKINIYKINIYNSSNNNNNYFKEKIKIVKVYRKIIF